MTNHSFAQVARAEIPRNAFNRSHGYKTTFNADLLIPVYVDEVLPGDTFNLRMTAFARMATPIHPIMDNIWLDTFFFFIPNRLVWENWHRFMGEETFPGASTDYTIPMHDAPSGGWTSQSLGDYFGLPTLVDGIRSNELFFRAYNLCWNQWFRDENLTYIASVPTDDTTQAQDAVRSRQKKADYFTSCLPWPQKGEAVDLPLGGQAPVTGIGVQALGAWQVGGSNVTETGGGIVNYPQSQLASQATPNPILLRGDNDVPSVYADLSEATAVTINQMRQAFQIQKMLERDARGGTRYTEIIYAHFGVVSPDMRLQRPEYLGGGTVPVNINPVQQTSETQTGGNTPLGNLAGYGTASINGHGFTKSFTEHGMIIGMICARADLTYQQGHHRMWTRSTRYDYFWPALSHLGEQAVLSQEIYADGTINDQDVFGYQERWAEMRYKPSQITGKFRSNDPESLDPWHLAQDFGDRPLLNSTFIRSNTPMERVVAVPSEPRFLLDCYFQLNCARPLPLYGTPGYIDRF